MKQLLKVVGHASLVRDIRSTAIINTNRSAYLVAKKRVEDANKHKDSLRNATREINNLKNEMREIKDLLIELVDNKQ
jgi:hypothetical protein